MKAVMISIQPKWVEKILSGEKTIEVRKTAPKIETPFKCYIYCTNDRKISLEMADDKRLYFNVNIYYPYKIGRSLNGKVVGEFVCKKIDEYTLAYGFSEKENKDGRYGDIKDYCYFQHNLLLDQMCLTEEEFNNYGKGETLYGWHISDLKIYDKPKEISEFLSWHKQKQISQSDTHTHLLESTRYITIKPGDKIILKPITRPPMSWCYVEGN